MGNVGYLLANIVTQFSISKSSAHKPPLNKLVDDLRLNLTTLKSLNVTFEPLVVVRLLERALPSKIREDWEKSLNLETLPTLDQIYKFLHILLQNLLNILETTDMKGHFLPAQVEIKNNKNVVNVAGIILHLTAMILHN